jgi:TonB family protein
MNEIRPLAGAILLMATVALASLPGCATTPAPESRKHDAVATSPAPLVGAAREPRDSLSALRRPVWAPGNAGQRGESWAGIEGEPLPLDSTDPRYNDYLDGLRRMIKERWGYPCVKDHATGRCEYKSVKVTIVFGILKDGRVPTLEVVQPSGYEIYDNYAANAIRLASPFPPVPQALMATAQPGSAGVKSSPLSSTCSSIPQRSVPGPGPSRTRARPSGKAGYSASAGDLSQERRSEP